MNRRLLREASSSAKQHPHLASIEPDHDNLYHWAAVLRGPPDSPYAGGTWRIEINVHESYPLNPPEMRFVDNICHPNVAFKTGEICLDVLKSQWTPAWTLVSALLAVQLLLAHPEPNSPLDVDAANLVRAGDHKGFAGLVRYYMSQH